MSTPQPITTDVNKKEEMATALSTQMALVTAALAKAAIEVKERLESSPVFPHWFKDKKDLVEKAQKSMESKSAAYILQKEMFDSFFSMSGASPDVEKFRTAFGALQQLITERNLQTVDLVFSSTGIFERCRTLYQCLLSYICYKTVFFSGDEKEYLNQEDKTAKYLASPEYKAHKEMFAILCEGGLQKEISDTLDQAEKIYNDYDSNYYNRLPKVLKDFIKSPEHQKANVAQSTFGSKPTAK